jgi:hypothetical protein
VNLSQTLHSPSAYRVHLFVLGGLVRVWLVVHLATARLLRSLNVASLFETALFEAATSCTGSRHALCGFVVFC